MFKCLPGTGYRNGMKLVYIMTKRSFQTSSVRTVKNESKGVLSELGKAIKQLNKENKALFGKLLETRKQKRKKKLKTLNANAFQSDVKSDFSSELWWWKASSPKRTVTLRVDWKNPSLKQEKETVLRSVHDSETVPVSGEFKGNAKREVGTVVDLYSCKTRILCNYPTTEIPFGKGDNSADLALANVSEDVSQFNFNELGVGERCEDRKTNPVKLPAIIIRHITTFPLKNTNRRLLEWSDGDKNLLHISADDENSCKNKSSLSCPSVTKILNATMSESSRSALERWRQKMILQLGYEGFASFQKDLLEQGSKFHAALESFLSGSPAADLSLEPCIEGCWESVRCVLSDITDVRVLESHVIHPYLKYRGVIDCVAQYCGKPVLIEWKRSDRKKPELVNTYDAPVQLCAYLGAMNYDENYQLKVQGGLVVVAYSDGSPANTFKLNVADCNKYWAAWLIRLQKYWMLQNQGLDVVPG